MKAAIYCRLSEEDRNKQSKDDDSGSIQNQKMMLIQYAVSQGWDLYDIYSDDDYAGSDRNRPQFQRLLADAKARRFDIVLCKTQSRFTRELELVEKYIHGLFPAWGIRFVSIVDNADTANRGNKKSRQINGLVNEWYLEDMSENIRSVLTNRRQNGFHIGAFAPYGYEKDPEKRGHLVIDPEAAGIVREIFSLFADGYGKSAIAKLLNSRGIPNPTEYKRQKGMRYKQPEKTASTLWKYPTVASILTNEVYIGNLVQGKYGSVSYKTRQNKPRPKESWIRVTGTHEPVIGDALWNQVQMKVCSHAKPFASTGRVHPLSGKVVCMHCGYAVSPHKNHGHYYLQCHTRQISDTACPGAFMPMAELEGMILGELRKLNQELLDRRKLERTVDFQAALHEKKAKVASDMRSYQQKIGECTQALKQLYVDKTTGAVSAGDYDEMAEAFRTDRARFEAMVRSCLENIRDMESRTESEDQRREHIVQYANPEQLTRTMTDFLIDHIEIGRRDRETGNVPVSIFWSF